MKISVASILAVGGLALVGVSTHAADQVVIKSGNRFELKGSPETRAVTTCAEAFVARILPDSKVQVRLVAPAGGANFSDTLRESMLDVELVARLKSNNELLATSSCTVDRTMKIHSFNVQETSHRSLAALRPSELYFASR